MIFVDTDIIIDVLRRHAPAMQWLEKARQGEEVVLPGYVLMELIQGCRNREEQESMRGNVESYRVIWATEEECQKAVDLRL